MKVGSGSSVLELPRLGNDEPSCPDSVGRKRNHYAIEPCIEIEISPWRATFVGPSARELEGVCYNTHASIIFMWRQYRNAREAQRSELAGACRCSF